MDKVDHSSELRKRVHPILGSLCFLFLCLFALAPKTTLGAGAEKPNLRVYCSTSDPLGIVYFDAKVAALKRLLVEGVFDMDVGPTGRLAVLRYADVKGKPGAAIDIYQSSGLIMSRTLQSQEPALIGWQNRQFVFRDGGRTYSLDPDTGVVKPLKLDPKIFAIKTTPLGIVTILQSEDGVAVDMHDKKGLTVAKWRIPGSFGGTLSYTDFAVVGNRYVVLGIHQRRAPRDFLWVLDSRNGKQRKAHIEASSFCALGDNDTLLAAICKASTDGAKKTSIERINLRSLRREPLLSIRGLARLAEVSFDRRWIVATRAYEVSGPGRPNRLIAVRMMDGHVRVLLENVYDCLPVK